MKWLKLKRLFAPDNNYPWMVSHAANPTAEKISESVYRIFFSCRDTANKSQIGYVDIDFDDNFKILSLSNEPVISPGELGLFDDSGTTITCIETINNSKFLYYLGWNLKVTVPWSNAIGLAIFNEKNNKFEKYSSAPIIDRNAVDPYSLSYPTILFDNGKFRMWYGTCLHWKKTSNGFDYAYTIKYAESLDGINWDRTNQIHINLLETESAIARPIVHKRDNLYYMWYSYKGGYSEKNYKIGYAISKDGFQWERKDSEVGIDVSNEGWDSEMVCYAFIVNHRSETYMLYNGNNYGKTGFGIAQLIN